MNFTLCSRDYTVNFNIFIRKSEIWAIGETYEEVTDGPEINYCVDDCGIFLVNFNYCPKN